MFDSPAGCHRSDAQPVPVLTTVAEADHYISACSDGVAVGSLRIKNIDSSPVLADLHVSPTDSSALASSLISAALAYLRDLGVTEAHAYPRIFEVSLYAHSLASIQPDNSIRYLIRG